MSRIRQRAEKDYLQDFVDEINAQCWRFGYKTQSSLGDALGISQVTAGKYLRDPADMKFTTLRKLICTLRPDPLIVLKALGYSPADLKKLKGDTNDR